MYADLLQRIVIQLEDRKIPYMVTGSVASSLHGKPRSTFDLDIVIDPTEQQLERFLGGLDDPHYVSPAAAKQAYKRRGMFNLIDYATGIKIDFILRKDREYSREEFRRRTRLPIMSVDSYVVTAEDSILSKLEWSKLGQSERQINDAIEICRANSGLLEIDYLNAWASKLGVSDLLSSVLKASEIE